MRRIRSTGCGYSLVPGKSYTCSGVAHLDDMFKTTPTNIFGTEVIRTTSSEEYSNEEWIGNPDRLLKGSIDNYSQLPQAFEGFVMTLTPVLDMDATNAGPEVPELECRINFDPFAKVVGSVLNTSPEYTSDSDTRNDGFLNLYNSVFPNYTKTVYVEAKTKEQLQTEAVADNLIYYDMPAYLSGSTVTEEEGIGWVIQPNTDQETGKTSYVSLMAGPGILEPMLDTSFPPIGVDTITGPDIIGDFTMWEFNTIAQWQHTVDTRLNNIRIPSVTVDYGKVNGLINLENAKNQDGPCTNFQIQQISTNSVIQFDALNEAELGYPEYFISGGDIVVDGETIANISGLTATGAIFDAYLDIFKYGQTEDTLVLGATVTDRYNEYGFPVSTIPATGIFQHKKFEYIGSVTRTINTDSPVTGGTIYTLYEIEQGDCIYEVTLGGGTAAPAPCEQYEYEGPFKVVAGTTSGTIALEPFDYIGADPQLYTGFVVNGDLTIPAPIGSVDVGVYADVYAKIDLNTNKVSYEMEEPDTGTQEQQEEQEDTPPDPNIVYVRLARVSRGSVQYETVVLGGSTTGYNGNIKGNPVSIYSDFCVAPTPSLFPIDLNKDVPFVTGGTVYEVIGGTLTGNYGVAPSGGTYAATVYATQEFDILQIQHGDIVLCGNTVTPTPVVGSAYSGPFTVTVTDGTATITCDDCPEYGDEPEITGYYSINGGVATAMPVLDGVAVDAGDYVYLQFSTGAPVLSTTPSTSPAVYNVLLARVTGATSAAQLHYGNIHVDGRWT